MKNVMLASVAAVVGFAGLAETAKADHRHDRRSRRDLGVRIAGAVLNQVLSGPSRRRGPVFVSPGFGRPIARHRHYHVSWHMDGTRRLHFHSHSAAHRYEDYLRSLGAHVRLVHGGGYYDVIYHMHGSRRRTFSSHRAAHAFEQRLERLGMHARVIHH